MIRKIIHIDQEKCKRLRRLRHRLPRGGHRHGRGQGHAPPGRLLRRSGDCLPACPTGAITFVEREAAAYDEAAVKEHLMERQQPAPLACGCPGTHSRELPRQEPPQAAPAAVPSQLGQWPVQIKLAPVNAPYFQGAHLLIAADCTAYAYGNFHQDFIRGRSPSSAAPSWMRGTTRRSSPPSCPRTTSRA